ncbi:hypothetical protein G9C98_005253 [Cotesia typhae]|uniref:HMG box domain-containing protein n=1 Tax=Cotesia typhae TaxID=2053667 RepID=A0A8J5VDW3_9HYME|nr:hypothetical protein G9C98_005253 [Cotesia typhae]
MESYGETGSDNERINNGSPVQNDGGRQEIIDSNATQSNVERTRSRSPIVPIRERSWKSVNAFINYTSDFSKVYSENHPEFQGKINRKNLLKQAGEKWKQMSQNEKQPYIDGAKRIRKLKAVERRRKSHQEEKEAAQLKIKRPRKAAKNKSYRDDDEDKPKKKMKNKDIHYKNVIIKNVSDSSSDSEDQFRSKTSDTSI